MLKIISLLKITFSIGPFKERENITQNIFKYNWLKKEKKLNYHYHVFVLKMFQVRLDCLIH